MFVPLNISAMYIYSILNVYLNVEKKKENVCIICGNKMIP